LTILDHWTAANFPAYPALMDIIKTFQEQNPAIRVKSQQVPNVGEKLQVMIAGGIPPDVSEMEPALYGPMAAKGAVLNLRSFIQQDKTFDLSDFWPARIQTVTWRGGIYAVPMDNDVTAIYYNRELFTAAGLQPPAVSWRWEEEWLQAARRLTKGQGATSQFGTVLPPWNVLVWADGGHILNRARTACQLDQSGAAKALQFLEDLQYRYRVAPRPADLASRSAQLLFESGRVGLYYSGPFYAGNMAFRKVELPWDVAPMPQGPAGAKTQLGGSSLGLITAARHHADAWEFVRYFTSTASLRSMTRYVSWLFARKSAASAINAHLIKPAQMQVFIQAMDYARGLPIVPQYAQMLTAIGNELDLLNEDKATGQQVGQEIVRRVDALLQQPS
jgi:multiple sugar transport system substrate-binding protein